MKNVMFFLLVLAGMSCTKKQYSSHNSMNSLDWEGRYEGQMGEQKGVLLLRYDLSYTLIQGDKARQGGFAWGPDGGHIVLPEEKLHFLVGENFLQQVNAKGKPSGNVRLEKVGDLGIKEKYWKLVELEGKPIKGGEKEPHLIIKENDTVQGSGGCNRFHGAYELDEKNMRIRFSKVAATMMACQDAPHEAALFRVLSEVDNYATDGKSLSLHKARMAPLARFEVVYLK
jgi:copper homeostasis protein (lipoprotein)